MINQTSKDNRFRTIIEAICYWLGYQTKIGREFLIHEASLRYPVADAITAGTVNVNEIELEYLHPIFKSRKIDLVIFDEGRQSRSENDPSKVKEVFEFKLAKRETGKEGSDEQQRVFNDVARLAYCQKWAGKKCYFLMCGPYESFKAYFVGQKKEVTPGEDGLNKIPKATKSTDPAFSENWEPTGIYKDWFAFDLYKKKRITFSKGGAWGLEPFQSEYKIRDQIGKVYSDSLTIVTQCLAITKNGLGADRTHAAGIWEVFAE